MEHGAVTPAALHLDFSGPAPRAGEEVAQARQGNAAGGGAERDQHGEHGQRTAPEDEGERGLRERFPAEVAVCPVQHDEARH
ncbi:MAG: hypothetical protein ACK559_05155, partial [bacterium]